MLKYFRNYMNLFFKSFRAVVILSLFTICVLCSRSYSDEAGLRAVYAFLKIKNVIDEAAPKAYCFYELEDKTNEDKLIKETKLKTQFFVEKVLTAKDLYALAVLFQECCEHNETFEGRCFYPAYERTVMRLAQLGTEEAYRYFIRLKRDYGRDGGGSTSFKVLEFKYLKKYSKDERVLKAKTWKEFI